MLNKKFLKSKGEYEVTFEYNAEKAKQVALVSDFNGWQPVVMKKAKEGPFRTKLRLPKDGKFQFRYLVDNTTWVNDEAADAYLPNEHGSQNGVVFTSGS